MKSTKIVPLLLGLILAGTSAFAGGRDETLRQEAARLEKQGRDSASAEMYSEAAGATLAVDRSPGGLRTAANDMARAGYLSYQTGNFKNGVEYYVRTLSILKEAGINEEIPLAMSGICWGLYKTGRFNEAIKHCKEALAGAGPGQDEMRANSLNIIGLAYEALAQYADAEKYYEEAGDIYTALRMEGKYANVLNNAGMTYFNRSNYDTAFKYIQKALSIHKRLGMYKAASVNKNNLGLVYLSWGRYDTALRYFEEALSDYKRLGLNEEIPTVLMNIGEVYFRWGQYENSLSRFEEVVEQSKKLGKETGVADGLAKLAELYYGWNRRAEYGRAMKYLEEALAINKRLGRQAHTAGVLTDMGKILISQVRYDEALTALNEAFGIVKVLGIEDTHTGTIDTLGQVYFRKGQYDRAIEMFSRATSANRKKRDEGALFVGLYNIGRTYHKLENYKKASEYFLESVELVEKLRKTVPGPARIVYTAKQIAEYQYLVSSFIRLGDYARAVEAMELGRAKFLAEQMAGPEAAVGVPAIEEIKRVLPPDSAVVMYSNINRRNKAVAVISKEGVHAVEFSDMILYDSKWREESAEATSTLAEIRGVQIVERDKTKKAEVELKPACSCDEIINYYRTLLIASGGKSRGVRVTKRGGGSDKEIKELARILYRVFVGPVESQLKGKKNLIFVTDGALGILPFETLMDSSGNYMADGRNITYMQSLSVMSLLGKRKYDSKSPLLAFGAPEYGGNLPKLPHTRREVNAVSGMINGAEVFTGRDASEENVKRLSSSGKLSEYKVLHFATHGTVVPAKPELSAIVLTARGAEDGYLRMAEISKLKLKADFVALSACETGLGKLYEGEGVVGLTRAFMIAGANGIAVSLWQVADDSTSDFMAGIYRLKREGLSYAEAISEMKRKFIRGDYGSEYKSPYHWAPFVYYGR